MNEFTTIREHGPQPTPLADDVLAKARADLLAEINAETPAETEATAPAPAQSAAGRPVRLRRRAVIVAAAVAAAAAVAGVVATSGTGTPTPPSATDEAPAPAPVLVEFHMPTLPPELRPIPDGVTKPGFTAEPGWLAAVYKDADPRPGKEMSAIYVIVSTSRRGDAPRDNTTYAGKPALLTKVDQKDPKFREVSLGWERSPGQWITLTGIGDFAAERTVRSLADTLVDTDKRLSLDISVAPAGWELYAFKGPGPDGDGAVTSLRDPRNPDRTIHVSTMLGLVPNYGRVLQDGPHESIPVSINGRHGDLVLIPGYQWMLQAPLPDGRAFQLQVPADFTRQQVIELAEGVS
jgi:hypothetical protein